MRPTTETFEKWNEEHAKKHDLDEFYNHPNPVFRYIENKRIKRLIELADIKADDKVIEVGCGAGHILERIKQGKLYGIDISEVQIKRAKERLGSRVNLQKTPGENIPFEDKFFDKILCSEVIEHVLDPVALLKEMRRVLKDDGILSLSIPNENLINTAKKVLRATGLIRLVEPKKTKWDLASKDNLDEWHLHEFNLDLIKKYIDGLFMIEKTAAITNPLVPFRYVLKLRKV
ncbi:MAG: class I SAM-dependent methyltransferase [Ignavibacteriae bacterium]|nr:MAG: class I SAM-dependent methyltransferase [Ignavibacteriota bacterium]